MRLNIRKAPSFSPYTENIGKKTAHLCSLVPGSFDSASVLEAYVDFQEGDHMIVIGSCSSAVDREARPGEVHIYLDINQRGRRYIL